MIEYSASDITYCRQHEPPKRAREGGFFDSVKRWFTCGSSYAPVDSLEGSAMSTILVTVSECKTHSLPDAHCETLRKQLGVGDGRPR
jgi:hypothetical protein